MSDARTELEEFIRSPEFSCLGARSALKKDRIVHHDYPALGCPRSAAAHYADLHDYARALPPLLSSSSFRTFVATFSAPADVLPEKEFEALLWQHLQFLHDIDAQHYGLQEGATSDPSEPTFGFHAAGHAFFLVGLHPGSSRASRRFSRPAIAFNSLEQFVRLEDKFFSMQDAIRKRETNHNGSVNPSFATYEYSMPSRHYSGRFTEEDWTCPFVSRHEAATVHFDVDTMRRDA